MNFYHKRNIWTWGCSISSEIWNGRLAMLAFIIIFCIEFFFLYQL
uniref:CAB/ELIP/HLIP superfamily protein n=1 Tax=Gracilaria edulis TaxID=172966 RepID=A0A6C0A8X1_9FLOR|nr:hypothetical protein [Gracilaria edulis]QHS70624.1 hypothetical protein [Gracilaria edulis]UAD85697.1 hypothetical protein [Gracilaria edulis]